MDAGFGVLNDEVTMIDFAPNPSSSSVLDVTLRRAELDGGAPIGRAARRSERPAPEAAKTIGILGLCALSFWFGSEAIEWVVTAGEWLVGEAKAWLFELRRGLAATGAC